MTAGCTIEIEWLDDGRVRATSTVFPDLEVVADNEQAARTGFEKAVEHYLRAQLDDKSEHESNR